MKKTEFLAQVKAAGGLSSAKEAERWSKAVLTALIDLAPDSETGGTEGEGASETAEERRQRRHGPVKIVRRRVFEGFSAGGVRRAERRHWCPMWGRNAQGA